MRSVWKSALRTPGIFVVLLSVALGFSLAANFYNQGSKPASAAVIQDQTPANWRTAFENVAAKLRNRRGE
ncbi:MAG: hypothetical protein M1423_03795, partial [Acidobacteria bacterium]|nr:hypothetical protein [Acidobacteriota bacterium]